MPDWMMSSETSTETQPFEPWQFFTLAGLIGATIVVFFAKGQTAAAIILLSLTVFAAAAVGFAALRAVGPLAGLTRTGGASRVASRTRSVLEREKGLALRAIKELEFDRAMGKMSEKDFTEMSGRLRARAARIIRQLDAGGSYRELIEKELERRVGRATNSCPSCQSANDPDARFCKKCGTALEAQS
jgi:hypothetical protein